jgi:hypothetical protein
MKLFGTLRTTTNQLLLIEGNIPDTFRCFPTADIRLLFNENLSFGGNIPARFLSLMASDDVRLFEAEGETITASGALSEKTVFDERTGDEIIVPLLVVANFARHGDIALRAFEISKSHESASAEDNWLRAENELLGLS